MTAGLDGGAISGDRIKGTLQGQDKGDTSCIDRTVHDVMQNLWTARQNF